MPTLSHTGVDLYFECYTADGSSRTVSGERPTVLLLAGIASDIASWAPVTEALAQHADIILLDNRCAGRTRPIPIDTSRELMVQDVLKLLDECRADKVTLVGHSMGALTSWAVASAAPERISGVVAASAPFAIDPSRIQLFNTLAKLRTTDNEADWFRLLFHFLFSKSFFADAEKTEEAVNASLRYEHRQLRDAFITQCNALPSYLPLPELPDKFAFPCLALTGANDVLFTPDDLKEQYASHPEVELRVIPDAAHSVHWENPDAFVDVVSRFAGF